MRSKMAPLAVAVDQDVRVQPQRLPRAFQIRLKPRLLVSDLDAMGHKRPQALVQCAAELLAHKLEGVGVPQPSLLLVSALWVPEREAGLLSCVHAGLTFHARQHAIQHTPIHTKV
eukprot:CAMPEP_0119367052 /NCGR_PEP_ID=MMETSP1334-20130426/13860_1 /TAXON_ID=127549 /ORGANISM="Calcidiscus leptoporus, Strain RCC1130" /LENGTH=114 /DNA_ID=CAMNT_0007383377 /DNA_START=659 /DNA_END=1003 /DNA_ORIENTATION=-